MMQFNKSKWLVKENMDLYCIFILMLTSVYSVVAIFHY